jgi:hypothetical protein
MVEAALLYEIGRHRVRRGDHMRLPDDIYQTLDQINGGRGERGRGRHGRLLPGWSWFFATAIFGMM